MMRFRPCRIFRAGSVAGVLALAACAGGAAGVRPGAPPDTTLEGAFRWTTFDRHPAPVEFPPRSGVMLVAGSLRLEGAAAAREGAGRFALRFSMRATPGDSAAVTGQDGRFRIVADSLHFTPEGREDRPPVRFRYAWLPGGVLALTDRDGHVWGYVRQ